MPTQKITHNFIALFILLTLILSACGGSPMEVSEVETVGEAPAKEEAHEAPVVRNAEEAPAEEAAAEEAKAEPADLEIVEAPESITEEAASTESETVATESGASAPAESYVSGSDSDAPAAGIVSGDDGMEEPTLYAAVPTGTPAPSPTAVAMADTASEEMAETEGEMMLEREETDETVIINVPQSEPLRAGEVDDNANWDDYLLYRRNYRGPRVNNRDVTERYIIEVNDGQGNPILGATVRVYLNNNQQQRQEIYSARTYANGQAMFHPLALGIRSEQSDRFVVEVEKDNLTQEFALTRFDAQPSTSFSERWTVTLNVQNQADTLDLDVLFLIDATGSMADEIAKIQSTIFDVAARIDGLPGQPNARYGMVTYRDRGDSFVTNTFEFTPDVQDFHRSLATVFADGGGDYPESLNEGLHNALHNVEWRGGEAVQLVFLVADAPPHLDYHQDYDYSVEMETAAQRGIKIFPIASSGLDDQGEYIFRQLAQFTQGRFVFLTYEGPNNGGAPGDTTTHHVDEDDYSVENLDDLLVKLVREELGYQSGQVARIQ